MINFILLLILHLIGDFYLQTDKVAKCKGAQISSKCDRCKQTKKCNTNTKFNFGYIIIHSLIYAVPFLTIFFMTNALTAAILIGILLVSHVGVDILSCCANKKFKNTLVFLVDQAIHVGVLYLIFRWGRLNTDISAYSVSVKVTFIVLLLISPCSILINKVMKDIFSDTVDAGLFDVGSVIGILERVLVVVFAYLGDLAVIAVIITVKTWARSKDLDDPGFRNKYLLGTLASMVLAALVFMLYKMI
jgi:hypothetical protein